MGLSKSHDPLNMGLETRDKSQKHDRHLIRKKFLAAGFEYGGSINTKYNSPLKGLRGSVFWSQIRVTVSWEYRVRSLQISCSNIVIDS